MASSPVEALPWERQKKTGLKPWKKIVLVTAGVLLLVGGSALVLTRTGSQSIFSSSVLDTATFPLLEPKKLPPGFMVDSNSLQFSETVVTFAISNGQKKTFIVTEQAVPDSFDFEAFYDQFEMRKSVNTASGQAVIGRFEDTDLASIVAGDTWILIRAPYGADASFEAVVQSFSEQRS